tara:strand:+ start:402 stop:1361 length:960 start_codon:yes stop_codon:yes gene_type:complete
MNSSKVRDIIGRYGLLIIFIGLVVFFKVLHWDVFLTADNLRRTILSSGGFVPLLILASGLTVVMSMGDFDLSFGNTVGLAAGAGVALMVNHGQGWPIALVTILVMALGVGLINGALIAYVGASSFVITLASGTILFGFETLWTDNRAINGQLPEFYIDLGKGVLFWGLRAPLFFAVGFALLIWLMLDRTELGRYMYAIGGNREAARLAGIPVKRIRLIGFIIVALASTLVAVLMTANIGGTRSNIGPPFLLTAYAAVFLGAAVFKPGQFNLPGTILGALFLRVVEVGLLLQQIDSSWINVSKGGILVFGVLLSQLVARE